MPSTIEAITRVATNKNGEMSQVAFTVTMAPYESKEAPFRMENENGEKVLTKHGFAAYLTAVATGMAAAINLLARTAELDREEIFAEMMESVRREMDRPGTGTFITVSRNPNKNPKDMN